MNKRQVLFSPGSLTFSFFFFCQGCSQDSPVTQISFVFLILPLIQPTPEHLQVLSRQSHCKTSRPLNCLELLQCISKKVYRDPSPPFHYNPKQIQILLPDRKGILPWKVKLYFQVFQTLLSEKRRVN